MLTLSLCLCLNLIAVAQTKMEGFIVGGNPAKIRDHPYAAFLAVNCSFGHGNDGGEWICGSTILNQRIILTASHCVFDCKLNIRMIVRLGNEDRTNGTIRSVSAYMYHSKYNDVTLESDVALVKLSRPLKFNARISRAAVLKHPPYSEPAFIAGWGLTNVEEKAFDIHLKSVDQKVWKHAMCQMYFDMPRGTICASGKDPDAYPAQGDSGSGLVVREYIVIGLVSYKVSMTAKNVIIYTDVGYYYDWITHGARNLFCSIV